jgi:hypothetical protein
MENFVPVACQRDKKNNEQKNLNSRNQNDFANETKVVD